MATDLHRPRTIAGRMMLMTAEERLIARDILSYLLAHTTAEDTIEGIVEWWLLEEKIKRRTKEVQKILDDLVAERLIVPRVSQDSRIRYRINKRNMKKIQATMRTQGFQG